MICVCSYWSIKVSTAAQTFATSTWLSAPLKCVTIEYLEQDVICLNEKVFTTNFCATMDTLIDQYDIKVEVANCCAAVDTLIDQDGLTRNQE